MLQTYGLTTPTVRNGVVPTPFHSAPSKLGVFCKACNKDSNDEEYMRLIGNLREKQKALANKIADKVYEYGFLRK